MSFTATIVNKDHLGNKRLHQGTYTNSTGGDTGGDITTGLNRVDSFWVQPKGSSVATNASVVNETFPVKSAVTIVTDADQDGYWFAIGI